MHSQDRLKSRVSVIWKDCGFVIFDSNLHFGHACNWVYNIQIFPKKTLKMFQTTVKDMDVNLSAVCMFFPLRKQVISKVKPT